MEYDYIIIGSGFGSSVSALRLTEKGYKVLVIEKGKRYYPKDFAKTNWNLPKWLWAPQLFCYGIQKLNLLNDVLILSGTGVGGGSLVYANTLLIPPETYFNDPTWAHLEKNWKNELLPFYKTAQKMLGVVKNPEMSQMDKLLKEYAGEIGRADYFKPTEVGVYFGEPGKTVPDPYFDGKGPARTGCTKTSHCMVGCKDGGKNTLDKNYLYLAEQQGLEILAEHEVTEVRADKDDGGRIPRPLKYLWQIIRHPVRFLKISNPLGWAKKSIVLLVMQTLDNSITLTRKRKWWALFKKVVTSAKNERKIPAYIPGANEAARELAKKVDGIPQSAICEVLFNIPVTAHILGGCVMGKDETEGVTDSKHKVFGYDNMYVVDGSAIPANLGVNPSLSITAMAERAMNFIKKK